MRLILTRHCETDWNVAKRIQGHTDVPLNENGRQQALQLGKKLADDYPDVGFIVSSDLKRAIQTARIIAVTSHTLLMDSNRYLRECDHGIFDGMLRSEIASAYPEAFKKLFSCDYSKDEPYDFSPFGGEPQHVVRNRHLLAIRKLSGDYSGQRILIVGHGRGLNTFLGELGYPTGLTRGEFREIEVKTF